MSNENDSIKNMAENMESNGNPKKMDHSDVEVPMRESREIQIPQINLDFLKAETGKGEVEEYINHVLNHNKSKAMAHILRGATGIFGNLNKGIVDIGLGILQYLKDKKVQGMNEH